jgi:1,6-anhydro-N-acetylmuramate kinase
MTGTSLDGLDVALVRITGRGLAMTADLLHHHAAPLGNLADTLRPLADSRPAPAADFNRAARSLGELHADTVADLLAAADTRPDTVTAVIAHGQTIHHDPHTDRGQLVSWQLFDPWPLVHRLGRPVGYDLRQADLVAGGQGAPITPIADPILYGADTPTVVVNLGGVCNITSYPAVSASNPATIEARDVGICNMLLDDLSQLLFNEPFDRGGDIALSGQANPAIVDVISSWVAPQTVAGSLGREQFSPDQVRTTTLGEEAPADWLASAVVAIAGHVARQIKADNGDPHGGSGCRTIVAGGGARNLALVAALRDRLPNLVISDKLGIPATVREAAAFAVLGALSLDGIPITLPQVTGSTAPSIAGAWAGLSPASRGL